MADLRKNSTFRVKTEGYTSSGDGVAKVDGHVIFVKGALDGETCDIKILKAGKNVSYAKIESIVSPSPHRALPECASFGKCGGCTLMHMDYDEELRYKKEIVNDALQRIGGCDIRVSEIYASPDIAHYRNKVIYNIQADKTTGLPVYGFFRPRSHDVIPGDNCLIGFEEADRICRAVTDWMVKYGVPPYDIGSGRGCIRHVFLRKGFATGQIQVGIVSKTRDLNALDEAVRAICAASPDVASIVLNVNESSGNTVLSGDFYTVYGKSYITDRLCGLDFNLSMRSFYQINPVQVERLYDKAVEFCGLTGEQLALDLYCGTGTITLCLAKHARKAIGAEIVPQAVEDAKENAKRNGIENAEFFCGDASDVAERFAAEGMIPDVITVDPPRKGLSPDVITSIAKMAPRRVVYVSCDPGTLARDIKLFSENGYEAQKAVCFDMFPRCSHVETVVLMARELTD